MANERGKAQTTGFIRWGCRTTANETGAVRRKALERPAIEGESPVVQNQIRSRWHLSSAGHVKSRVKPARPLAKAKYS